jgi:hypothetical protein
MHLVPASAGAPSWLDERDHCPAVGAGSSATVIGPAGPDAAAGVVAAFAATVDAGAAGTGAAAAFPAAALSAGFEHPASANTPNATLTHKPRIAPTPPVVSMSLA